MTNPNGLPEQTLRLQYDNASAAPASSATSNPPRVETPVVDDKTMANPNDLPAQTLSLQHNNASAVPASSATNNPLCVDTSVADGSISFLQFKVKTLESLMKKMKFRLHEKNKELNSRFAELKQLRKDRTFWYDSHFELIQVCDVELGRMNAELDKKNVELKEKDAELERKNAELKERNAELEEKDAKLKKFTEDRAYLD